MSRKLKKVVVTGGSGNLGSFVVRAFVDAGYETLNLDIKPPQENLCESWICDLTRSGDLYQAFKNADAVIHLAAYQAPGLAPDCETFSNNVTTSYNVLKAATDMGVARVVLASSVAAYGFLYAPEMWAPDYLPLDEDYPCKPRDPYGLAKIFGEQLADSFAIQGEMTIVSLRLSGVNFDLTYNTLPQRWADPGAKMGTFWSYIDARDTAVACRLAVEAEIAGHEILNISADTSRYPDPTSDLVRKYLPTTRIREGFSGHWSGLDNSRAKTILGFSSQHNWQDYLRDDGTPIAQP